MQVNSFFQGMLNIGAPGSQGTSQGASSEEIAKQFEDMLTEHAQQNKQEKPAVKKDGETAEKKPQQPQDGKQEAVPEEGQEVAAGLVMSQPVVLFDVIPAENGQQIPAGVDPLAGVQEQAPILQEQALPEAVQEQAAAPQQPEVEIPQEQPVLQEAEQPVAPVEPQPETPETEVEARPQEQPKLQVESETTPVADQEQDADTDVQEIWYDGARPVFQRETAAPVKVGENYEPVAPEEADAPQQLMNRLGQMLEQGDTHVEINLAPANLGKMMISITRTQEGALHVVLGAVSQKATDLLQQNSGSLQSLLAAGNQGEVRIEVQQQDPQEQLNQFLNPDEQNRQQQNQQQKPQKQAASEDFIQQLRLGLVDKEEE